MLNVLYALSGILVRFALELLRISNQAPRIVACLSNLTMVVLEPILILTRLCCAFLEVRGAASSGPLGTTLPQTSGSYVARKASNV